MLTRRLLPAFFLLFFHNLVFSQAPEFAWSTAMDVGRGDDIGLRINTDAEGNVVVLGSYQGRIQTVSGSDTVVNESPNDYTGWLAKWNAQNELVWSMNVPIKPHWSMVPTYDMAVDPQGNILISGKFFGKTDLDPGPGIFTVGNTSSHGSFILKLDPNGAFVWAVALNGSYPEEIHSLTCDSDGNILATGSFNETIDFDPGQGTNFLTSFGPNDVFLWKLDKDGNFLWAQTMVEDQTPYFIKIAADFEGNMCVFGAFSDEVDLDPGPGEQIAVSDTLNAYFIQKFDTNGNFLWANTFGAFNWSETRDLAFDANGNVYATGIFTATSDFDPGPDTLLLTPEFYNAIFVQKWTANGALVWVHAFEGQYFAGSGYAIAVDESGNVYSTGMFHGDIDFDPGPDTVLLKHAGYGDLYVHKFTTDGDFEWVRQVKSTQPDRVWDIALRVSGEVLITGSVAGTVDFDPGPDTVLYKDDGYGSLFVTSFSEAGDYVWSTTTENLGGEGYAVGLVVDHSGYSVVNGVYWGSFDADPGPGYAPVFSTNEADKIYLQRFDPNGNLEWTFLSPQREIVVATDAWNNVLVSGSFYGEVDFDPGPNELLGGAPGQPNVFVLKLSSSGEILWLKTISGNIAWPRVKALVTDATGNIVVAGSFQGRMDFDPGAGKAEIDAGEGYDLFVWKLDAQGNFQWVQKTAGDIETWPTDIDVDAEGFVFVTGLFRGEVNFNPTNGMEVANAGDSTNAFLIKYNTAGRYVWSKTWEIAVLESHEPQLVQDGLGHLFVGLTFRGTMDADPGDKALYFTSAGSFDVLLLNMDVKGNLLQAVQVGGNGSEIISSLAVDDKGDLYVAGSFTDEVDFDPDPDESFVLKPNGNYNFLMLLSGDLQFRWAGAYGRGSSASIAVDPGYNIFIFNEVYGNADIDPGPETVDLNSTTSRPYLVKLTRFYPTTYSSKLPVAWPNPTNAVTTISLSSTYDHVEATITTSDGRQVRRQQAENTRYLDVDLSHLPSGVYFIHLEGDDGRRETVRVVKN